ncbi:uncharacterized protein [Dermacentor albipictus]|uniref:uncharacterized protein isoform X1 n=1 Tax=Dermacentor albipictus TaxID=60249 RepID=UPI0031FCBEFA
MRCVAVGCKTGRKAGLRIHSFPRDPKRRLEWAVKVNIAENGKLWVPPKDNSYGVCEAHFEEDQYEPRRTDRKLKPFAVPTLFSHRKVPKQRRRLVRGGPTSSITNVTAAVDAVTKADTVISSATSVATVSTVTTPVVSSSVAKSQPAHLQPVAATNHASRANQAQPTQVTPSAAATLAKAPANTGPAFTVTTSGGNIILVPTNAQGDHRYVVGNSPVVPPVMVPTMVPNTGAPNTNPVLPSVSCLPNTGPIILVPVSKPSGLPVQSKVTSPNTQMPVILSVQSLAPNTMPAVGKPSDLTPILPRPPSYEKLQEQATALWHQSDELRRKVVDLSQQTARVKASLARQTERLSRFLHMDQIECLQKLGNDQPTAWTEPTLQLALDIYRCSPEAYRRLLVAQYPFPKETALRTFCIEKGICGGVPAELMQMVTLPQVDEEEEDENVNIVWL